MCWMDTVEYHKKPVKWKTTWISRMVIMTGRYKGKRKAGEIWQDNSGVYHAVFLAHLGEEAAMKGPEIIEEYLANLE